MVIHGLPRSTLDIDIYVPAKEDILKKLFRLAEALRLETEQKDMLDISHTPELFTGQWICFSYEGQDVLDVYFANEDEFNKLYGDAELKKDKSLSARVAALDDIIAMKKASAALWI